MNNKQGHKIQVESQRGSLHSTKLNAASNG